MKVYVTVNIFAHNRDFKELPGYLHSLEEMGVDGLIVADPGVLSCAKREVPSLSLHLSTQANVTNAESAQFWLEQGVDRLNLARELSLTEIKEIRAAVDGELEIFVHGALCISYSGRCMLSNYFTGRDANKGACAHPCRFNYALVEEKRPGEYFPIEEDERGTYIFNSKDLCLLDDLPKLIAAGANSLKIEGRMKSIFYVGGVVRVYRAALDYLKSLPETAWSVPELITLPSYLKDEIARLGTRGMTDNFIVGHPGSSEMIYDSSRLEQAYEPVAVVLGDVTENEVFVEMRNTTFAGDTIEYMGKGINGLQQLHSIKVISDKNGSNLEKANPGNKVFLQLDAMPQNCQQHGIFRRKKG